MLFGNGIDKVTRPYRFCYNSLNTFVNMKKVKSHATKMVH